MEWRVNNFWEPSQMKKLLLHRIWCCDWASKVYININRNAFFIYFRKMKHLSRSSKFKELSNFININDWIGNYYCSLFLNIKEQMLGEEDIIQLFSFPLLRCYRQHYIILMKRRVLNIFEMFVYYLQIK